MFQDCSFCFRIAKQNCEESKETHCIALSLLCIVISRVNCICNRNNHYNLLFITYITSSLPDLHCRELLKPQSSLNSSIHPPQYHSHLKRNSRRLTSYIILFVFFMFCGHDMLVKHKILFMCFRLPYTSCVFHKLHLNTEY